MNIRAALEHITRLAHDFSRVKGASYGASIMLVATPDQFTPALLDRLVFHEHTHTDALLAMLVLAPELLVRQVADAPRTRKVPSIALPVPRGVVAPSRGADARGFRVALPGAPTALLSGNASVFEDARTMADECADFAAVIRGDITKYFSESGEGRDVRSFASFRLSADPEEPVGVLNIDSDRPYVFGREREYYATINALLAPMLELVCTHVREYVRLRGPELFAPPGHERA